MKPDFVTKKSIMGECGGRIIVLFILFIAIALTVFILFDISYIFLILFIPLIYTIYRQSN